MYIVSDKTIERRAERALEQYKNNLEDAIRARTIELQEKEIRYFSHYFFILFLFFVAVVFPSLFFCSP